MNGTEGTSKKGLVILLVVVAVLVIVYVGGVNAVVTKQESCRAAWAQVENTMQRRADLIPNYVEVVKGYMAHEKEVFEHVADARAKLAGTLKQASNKDEEMQAYREFEGAFSRLLAVVENYPTLKADQTFIRLQDELAGTENRIAVERRNYNEAVRDLNTHIRKIPGSFFASMRKIGPEKYFEIDEKAKEVPKIDFGSAGDKKE